MSIYFNYLSQSLVGEVSARPKARYVSPTGIEPAPPP